MQDNLLLIDRISTFAGKVFAWCVVIMTVAICYEVFMRYVMRAPTTWAYDAGYMLYGALFVMAGAYALATGAHVRGDVLYRLFPIRCVLCLKNGYWPSRVQDVKDIDASTAQEYIDLEDQPR